MEDCGTSQLPIPIINPIQINFCDKEIDIFTNPIGSISLENLNVLVMYQVLTWFT